MDLFDHEMLNPAPAQHRGVPRGSPPPRPHSVAEGALDDRFRAHYVVRHGDGRASMPPGARAGGKPMWKSSQGHGSERSLRSGVRRRRLTSA